ncbi:MAG: 50S ribosomal protein L5 [Candidatus Marinimicrobia bacterium]|nr:50S ribosomal protein L5 [Candidatus Neomarinimicrobiota bacterium]MBL7023061.1 50S ribosomal protein L5 [Candidatus Neomarinimicrobiota bacterium]MBL7109081.1 50S ribosomal protein L5 [Candidatus Neomarinimicrobiota bacterium]
MATKKDTKKKKEQPSKKTSKEVIIPRLLKHYRDVSFSYLKEKLELTNAMRVPKITKIVLNMGLGDAKENSNSLKNSVQELTLISGQKPVITYSKKAISNFKIRAKDPVGARVTIRGIRMYEFLDRFISVATPRIKDFRGLSAKGFDGRGNYNFGIDEQVIFPEIDYDKIDKVRGMNITIVTNAHSDEEAYELLLSLGMPIRQKKSVEKEEAA